MLFLKRQAFPVPGSQGAARAPFPAVLLGDIKWPRRTLSISMPELSHPLVAPLRGCIQILILLGSTGLPMPLPHPASCPLPGDSWGWPRLAVPCLRMSRPKREKVSTEPRLQPVPLCAQAVSWVTQEASRKLPASCPLCSSRSLLSSEERGRKCTGVLSRAPQPVPAPPQDTDRVMSGDSFGCHDWGGGAPGIEGGPQKCCSTPHSAQDSPAPG